MLMLASYARLAEATLLQGRACYAIMPRAHYLCHGFRELSVGSKSFAWVPNALGASVQLDEDFIGVVSRWSRRVGPVLNMQRTMERYVVSAYKHFSREKERRHPSTRHQS